VDQRVGTAGFQRTFPLIEQGLIEKMGARAYLALTVGSHRVQGVLPAKVGQNRAASHRCPDARGYAPPPKRTTLFLTRTPNYPVLRHITATGSYHGVPVLNKPPGLPAARRSGQVVKTAMLTALAMRDVI